MNLVPLQQLLELSDSGVWGDEDVENGISVLRSTNFNNDGTIDFSKLTFRAIEERKREAKIIRDGDILLEKSGGGPKQPVGRVCLFRGHAIPHSFGNFIARLRPKADILSEFLFYFLWHFHVQGKTSHYQKQTTGIRNLETKRFLSIAVPVPPLPEQRRIVDLLSRAEGIVRLRREAEKKAAEIIPALFLDMFGDPATNPKGWPLVRFGDLAEKMSDGPFGSNLKSAHYVESGVRVIRLQNIGIGRLIDEVKAFVSPEHFASLPRNRCLPGDVIIGTLGDPNLRAFVLPHSIPEALNKADCVQFRCREGMATSAFVCWLMNMPSTLTMAASLVQGITLTRVSMGRLRELVVPVPPIALQTDFARLSDAAQSIQLQQSDATTKARATFDALLARAFSTIS